MERRTIHVEGMSCDGCERAVQNALRMLDGVTRVEADHEAESVEVVAEDDVSEQTVAEAVRDAGYEVVS